MSKKSGEKPDCKSCGGNGWCGSCFGSGETRGKPCTTCNGSGRCPGCGGSGKQ
jgi:hypothetical protein